MINVSVKNGVRYISVVGAVSNTEAYDFFHKLWTSEDYDSSLPEFYDPTAINLPETTLDGEGFMQVAMLNRQLHAHAPRVKVAYFAPDPVLFGMARQAIAYLGDRYLEENIRLFQDKAEAEAWIQS